MEEPTADIFTAEILEQRPTGQEVHDPTVLVCRVTRVIAGTHVHAGDVVNARGEGNGLAAANRDRAAAAAEKIVTAALDVADKRRAAARALAAAAGMHNAAANADITMAEQDKLAAMRALGRADAEMAAALSLLATAAQEKAKALADLQAAAAETGH